MKYDCIIIGSGPAGITASIYIKRAGFKVLIISKDESALDRTKKVENYYGFENAISGTELKENGIKQAKRLGVEILKKEVTGIKYEKNGSGYEIVVANQLPNNRYIANNVIIATGVNRNRPNIKGIKEYEGKGISYCAVCDAAFYKNKDVAVLGSGQYANSEISELVPIANSVIMLTNGEEPIENRSSEERIAVNDKIIKEFRGSNRIEEIEFQDNTKQRIQGIFIAQGTAGSLDFARKIGAKIENNHIIVNEKMETTIPNVYACGDCTGGILQISKAVYEGTVAGLEVIKKLREK